MKFLACFKKQPLVKNCPLNQPSSSHDFFKVEHLKLIEKTDQSSDRTLGLGLSSHELNLKSVASTNNVNKANTYFSHLESLKNRLADRRFHLNIENPEILYLHDNYAFEQLSKNEQRDFPKRKMDLDLLAEYRHLINDFASEFVDLVQPENIKKNFELLEEKILRKHQSYQIKLELTSRIYLKD
ncbi:MAG: hypothetical protein V4629_02215 [Pseudomonadota bacterium]